jgi:hypothetical protein
MRLSSIYGCGEAYFSKLLGENLEFLQLPIVGEVITQSGNIQVT